MAQKNRKVSLKVEVGRLLRPVFKGSCEDNFL